MHVRTFPGSGRRLPGGDEVLGATVVPDAEGDGGQVSVVSAWARVSSGVHSQTTVQANASLEVFLTMPNYPVDGAGSAERAD